MPSDLSGLIERHGDELVAGAVGRLDGRAEFLYDSSLLKSEVRRCLTALSWADAAGDPEVLTAAALALGRSDAKPARGYRRAQLVLEAICAETVEQVHRNLPRSSGRTALDRLRAVLGPAQVGLVAIFRDQAATSTTAPSA